MRGVMYMYVYQSMHIIKQGQLTIFVLVRPGRSILEGSWRRSEWCCIHGFASSVADGKQF